LLSSGQEKEEEKLASSPEMMEEKNMLQRHRSQEGKQFLRTKGINQGHEQSDEVVMIRIMKSQ
jgi:hypothetical protein